MTKRKTFSKELKLEAVRLLEQGDKSPNEVMQRGYATRLCNEVMDTHEFN